MREQKADPITSEVIGNALQSIAEEMGVSLIRSAYSTNIKERKDCSCALFTPDGCLIALAEHIPIHLGSMQGLIQKIASRFNTWNFHQGDVIIANDPYRGGGSHLPDVTLVQPVFYADDLVAFVANIAHWSDVGGRSPGVGTAGDSTEILQEGLRIPPIRIISQGKIRDDVLNLILVNMRENKVRLGDFRAQIASLRLGERRLLELVKKYGIDILRMCITEHFDYSEKYLQKALRKVPEGSYRFTDVMDDDGVSDEPLPINVKVTISHAPSPSINFDFVGTAPQAAGGINMVWAALQATVFYTVKTILAPGVPSNAGFQRPIYIQAPENSLVNAGEPAAVGGRTDTCQRVVDVIMGALSQAVPERVVAASNGATTAIIFGGTGILSGKDFVYIEALGGGLGARATKDGMDGVQTHITNTSNLPIEAMELEYPLRVLYYGLIPDTGGPGKFRGGLSIRKDIQVLKPIIFSAHSDRHRTQPWGLMNGLSGKCGQFILNPNTTNEKILPSKISNVLIKAGDIMRVKTAGGGGFGSPIKRPPESVVRDYKLGKITREQAQQAYGVVLTNQETVDWQATRSLREQIRKKEIL
ncbi:MAG: hydantoinase B/oxoprolinase family protein [Candidatus Hodarchaeota archaeon]